MFDSRKVGFESRICYNDVLNCTFGIHSSLTAGIPSYRVVFLNSEANNVNESITDNGSVGYAATADAVAAVAGVVKDGCSDGYSDLTFIPQSNGDLNVTVTVLGTMPVEVAAGEVVAIGADINVDAEGRAVAAGTATGLVALSAATGAGTANNPEYIVAKIS